MLILSKYGGMWTNAVGVSLKEKANFKKIDVYSFHLCTNDRWVRMMSIKKIRNVFE